MKAQKRRKNTKTLKRGKKLEKTKTLLTMPLTDVHVTGNQTGGGHEPPPPPPNP